MKKLILILSAILIASCNKSSDVVVPDNSPCPAYAPNDNQEFFVKLADGKNPPENISITYNGTEKLNTCDELIKQEPPIVSIHDGSSNSSFIVSVRHFGAFKELPKFADLKIVDLKDCQMNPVVLFQAEEIPLEFVTKIIGPESCNIKEFNADVGVLVN